jgi:hypothetical protein
VRAVTDTVIRTDTLQVTSDGYIDEPKRSIDPDRAQTACSEDAFADKESKPRKRFRLLAEGFDKRAIIGFAEIQHTKIAS